MDKYYGEDGMWVLPNHEYIAFYPADIKHLEELSACRWNDDNKTWWIGGNEFKYKTHFVPQENSDLK